MNLRWNYKTNINDINEFECGLFCGKGHTNFNGAHGDKYHIETHISNRKEQTI